MSINNNSPQVIVPVVPVSSVLVDGGAQASTIDSIRDASLNNDAAKAVASSALGGRERWRVTDLTLLPDREKQPHIFLWLLMMITSITMASLRKMARRSYVAILPCILLILR